MKDKRGTAGLVVGIAGIVIGALVSYFSSAYFFEKGKTYVHSELSNRALRRGVAKQQVEASKDADELYGLILETEVKERLNQRLGDAKASASLKGEEKGRAACKATCDNNIKTLRNQMSAQALEFKDSKEALTKKYQIRKSYFSSKSSRLKQQIYLERFWANYESAVLAANELSGVDDIAKLTENQRRWMVENAQAMVDIAERGRSSAHNILEALDGAIDDLKAVLARDPVNINALKRAVGRIKAGLDSARQVYVEGELLLVQSAE